VVTGVDRVQAVGCLVCKKMLDKAQVACDHGQVKFDRKNFVIQAFEVLSLQAKVFL
jgi:hypothetical protein